MLQRADAEKTQYSLVGKVGQGIYPQGSDKTHRPDDDRMADGRFLAALGKRLPL